MKVAFAIAWLLIGGAVAAESWTPPENPVPEAILKEAKADARAGDYESALAKQVWFHENAIKLKQSLSGVRRSFALANWISLGEDYPPALEKLKEIRDATNKRVATGKKSKRFFDDFHDLAAINRELDEEDVTVEAFRALDARDAELAARVYDVAEPALVKAKEYELCGVYIVTDKALRQILDNFELRDDFQNNPRIGPRYLEFATNKFVNESAMLVALLVVNDRNAEADDVVREVKKVMGDAKFHARLAKELDSALKGIVPKPWP